VDFKKSNKFFSLCLVFLPCISSILFLIPGASAEIVVFDDVTSVNNPVRITALTKGRFFPEGGKLVKFYINGNHIGTTLSGGDGFAFFKYLPSLSGMQILKAESDNKQDEGRILVTDQSDRVILVEIESALIESIFSLAPFREAKDVINEFHRKYRIIYLRSLLGMKRSRTWLKDNQFHRSPVLKWDGAEMIKDLQERGIRFHAIIASAGILSGAGEIEKRFSFEATENVTVVKDWKELSEQLQ
jgi:hypothetical protein